MIGAHFCAEEISTEFDSNVTRTGLKLCRSGSEEIPEEATYTMQRDCRAYAGRFTEKVLKDAYQQIQKNALNGTRNEMEEKVGDNFDEPNALLKDVEDMAVLQHSTYANTICAKVFNQAYDQLRSTLV